jgi:uncharacterized protein
MPNRLAFETSPYLLQHANNPVDWFPWGSEALEKAKREDKPIFLSIGYSSCHWCHVMEHESFEDTETARILNEHFVSVKVDREERPDLDQIYMQAVMAMRGGQGGWPLSAFLTSDQQVFFGGTYWPAETRYGMPSFRQVLLAVLDAFKNRRLQIIEQAAKLTEHLVEHFTGTTGFANEPLNGMPLGREIFESTVETLDQSHDFEFGGFGSAPKFPHSMDLALLLRLWRDWPTHHPVPRDRMLQMVTLTLDGMGAGGIYDHLGGGFSRYSVDDRWLVPHFEKMLYDNALLVDLYLDAYAITKKSDYARIARETLDYVLRDMTDPLGGFYSAEDADSEGVEGKFYVWSYAEILEILGDELGRQFCAAYDVTAAGNFEGHNILNLKRHLEQTAAVHQWDKGQWPNQIRESREKLLAFRSTRIRPGKDDKILVSWNGLMIQAFARAGRILQEPRYTSSAQAAARFLLTHLRNHDGRLLHTWRAGTAKLNAYLDDYAGLIVALICLHETDFDHQWLQAAVELTEKMVDLFWDENEGGFFFTAHDHETLIARTKEFHDSSVPSGNSMAALALLKISRLTGREDWRSKAEQTMRLAMPLMRRAPLASGQMLLVLDMATRSSTELVIATETRPVACKLAQPLFDHFVASVTLTAMTQDQVSCEAIRPLLGGKPAGSDSSPALYVCQDFACQTPIIGEPSIMNELTKLSSKA